MTLRHSLPAAIIGLIAAAGCALVAGRGIAAENNPEQAAMGPIKVHPDSKWNPARDAIGAVRRLSGKLDLAKVKPLPDLAFSGFCLADPRKMWVIFQPGDGPLTIQTGPGKRHLSWMNPATGDEVSTQQSESDDSVVTAKPPRAGNWELIVTQPAQ